MRISSGLGRTIFVAALAGGLFALFLLIAPRLTASSTDVAPTTVALTDTTVTTAPPVVTTTVAMTTTTVGVTTTTRPPVEDWNPAAMTPDNGYEGSLELAASVAGPGTGKEYVILADGDTATWRLRVTNTTDEHLWGVFAWVEGFGRAFCDHHHLHPMATTDCWVEGRAFAGTTNVVAWVNAWNDVRQVKDKVLFVLTVAE